MALGIPGGPGPPIPAPIGSQPHDQPLSMHPQGGLAPASGPSAHCPRPGTVPSAHLRNHHTTAHLHRLL